MTSNQLRLGSLEASQAGGGAAAFVTSTATALAAHSEVMAPYVDAIKSGNWEGAQKFGPISFKGGRDKLYDKVLTETYQGIFYR